MYFVIRFGWLSVLLTMLGGDNQPADLPSVALIEAVNDYRHSHGLHPIKSSMILNEVARLHVADLQQHNPDQGVCNMHSWSSNGDWTACCYKDVDPKASCMWDKPREISGFRYDSNGYEVAAWLSDSMHVEAAVELWQRSKGHNAVILNKGAWGALRWKAIGAAMSENYAVVWFGTRAD